MKRFATLAGLIAALLLSACAAQPTPYMPREGAFGYDQTQIDSQTWRVVFAGNVDTPRETVENYLLYRAAEIMLFGAHEKFIVLEKEVERTREYRPIGPYPYHYGGRHGRRSHADGHFGFRAPSYYALENYKAFATVRTYSGGPAPAGLQVYAARDVIARLGRFVILPK
jgi:hypothetical protein